MAKQPKARKESSKADQWQVPMGMKHVDPADYDLKDDWQPGAKPPKSASE